MWLCSWFGAQLGTTGVMQLSAFGLFFVVGWADLYGSGLLRPRCCFTVLLQLQVGFCLQAGCR